MNHELNFDAPTDAADVLAAEAAARQAVGLAQAAPATKPKAKAKSKPAKSKAAKFTGVDSYDHEHAEFGAASEGERDELDGLEDDGVLDLTMMSGEGVDDAARGALTVLASHSTEGAEASRRYLSIIGRFKNLTAAEEVELAHKAKAGDQRAFEKLCNHNLRLVVAVARKYFNRGLDFDDLVQEGNMGLMHAINKFDPTLGNRLTTYATFWINQAIGRGVKTKASLIRVPTHVQDAETKRRRAAAKARSEGNPDAERMEAASYAETARTSLLQNHASLSDVVGAADEGDRTFGDFLADDHADPEASTARRQTIELFMDSARALPERSRFILAACCDLLPDQAHELDLEVWMDNNNLVDFSENCRNSLGAGSTLQELSAALGLSRERINQIYRASMETIVNEMGASANGLENLATDGIPRPRGPGSRR